jgi:hypothetical protein
LPALSLGLQGNRLPVERIGIGRHRRAPRWGVLSVGTRPSAPGGRVNRVVSMRRNSPPVSGSDA